MLRKELHLQESGLPGGASETDSGVFSKACCAKSFLRGAFLASGSVSDPEKGYHLEIVCPSRVKADLVLTAMESFDVGAKMVLRKKSHVVYVKEGTQIATVLAAMGAGIALMEFENKRILKEMRNSVNRKVNCETANIHKTVDAAVKQMEDIRLVEQAVGLESLSQGLQEMARLRIQFPQATLAELGEMSDPRIGKSGVNHRLRKLGEIAQDIRDNGCRDGKILAGKSDGAS